MIPGLPDGVPDGVPSEGLTGEADGVLLGLTDGVSLAVPEGDDDGVPDGVPSVGLAEGDPDGLADPLPPLVTSRIMVALARSPCSPYHTLMIPSPPLTSSTTWIQRYP